jgi:hypothetical protein
MAMQFDFKAFLAEGFLMLFGYGIRSVGVKIPGEIAILIGFFGFLATISYGKFYTISVITNPYFLLFAASSIFLIFSILLRRQKSKIFMPHLDDAIDEGEENIKETPIPSFETPIIDPHNTFPQLNLESLKIWGGKWGKQYDHLLKIMLYDSPLGDPELQNQCYKYILYFQFEESQGGEVNKTKFNEMQWETDGYPVSECKADIYKKDASEIDISYEWNITTEEPRGVNHDLSFIVFNREEVKPNP